MKFSFKDYIRKHAVFWSKTPEYCMFSDVILKGKLHFSCSVICLIFHVKYIRIGYIINYSNFFHSNFFKSNNPLQFTNIHFILKFEKKFEMWKIIPCKMRLNSRNVLNCSVQKKIENLIEKYYPELLAEHDKLKRLSFQKRCSRQTKRRSETKKRA